MRKAYAHQEKIIREDPKKCGLWLGTGSGKGFIALSLAVGDILVICPKTIREAGVWEREYKEILTAHLEKYPSKNKFPTIKPRLTVMSKEEFKRDAAHLPRFQTVIADEVHTLLGVTPNTRQRNRMSIPKASQLYEAFEAYIERTKPERLYLLSATIVKSPMTVWAAAKILGRKIDFYKFRDIFYSRLPMPGREVWVPKHSKEIKEKLARIVHTLGYVGRLDEYFDVPEQTFITKYVELTPKQQARIRELRLEYPEPIVRIGKQHQVENGVLAGDEFNAPEMFPNAKEEAILDYALQFPRIVIFVKYTAQIKQIQDLLTKAKYHTWVLDGQTKNRGAVIKQAGEIDGILIVQAQISAGWEIPLTPVMIFASRTYSFVDYAQAQGRILRANALKKNLYINLVVRGGVDEAVDDSLANKRDFDERLYTL